MSIPKIKSMRESINQLLRVFKSLPFQGKGAQLFPPGFNQIEPGGVLGDKLDLDFRPGQQSSFHISALMYHQVIFNNQPSLSWEFLNYLLKQLDVTGRVPSWADNNLSLSCSGLKSPMYPHSPSTIIRLKGSSVRPLS